MSSLPPPNLSQETKSLSSPFHWLTTRISRSALFEDTLGSITAPVNDPSSVLASLEHNFPFDITSLPPQSLASSDDRTNTSTLKEVETTATEFNLFSTAGVKKVDLSAPIYEVPLINRTRPREYYFTSTYPSLGELSDCSDDKERMTRINDIVVSGLEIIQESMKPHVPSKPLLSLLSPLPCPSLRPFPFYRDA